MVPRQTSVTFRPVRPSRFTFTISSALEIIIRLRLMRESTGAVSNFKSQIFDRIVMRWNCRRGGRNDETGHFGNVVIHRYASGKKPVRAESNGSAPRLLPLHRGKNQDDRCQRLPGNLASFDWTATRERSALVVRTVRTLITVRTSSASSSPVAWCRSLKQRSKNAI